MKMKNGLRKVMSVMLAGAMAVGLAVTGGSNFGPKTVEAAEPPAVMDAASQVNYATILGRGVDYGIVAENFQQRMHMQTTYAVKTFSTTCSGTASEVNLTPEGSTAQFLVGDVITSGKEIFGQTTNGPSYVFVGGDNKNTLNIEATANVYATETGASQSNFKQQNFADVVQTINSETPSNIEAIYSNAFSRSVDLENKANSNEYKINYRDYFTFDSETKGTLDLSSRGFEDRVVYISVDNDLMKVISESDGLKIVKDSSTVVVFNIDNNVTYTRPYNNISHKIDDQGHQSEPIDLGDRITLHTYNVYVTGANTPNRTTNTSGKYSDTGTRSVDEEVCQKIIWNITTDKPVALNNTAGLFIIPNADTDVVGSSGGWVVARNLHNTGGEWHYIYGGGNQNVLADHKGQIHFAARKAFTHAWEGTSTKEDTTILAQKDQYSFVWYEDDSTFNTNPASLTEGNEINAQKTTVKNESTSKVQFPIIEFYTDDTHKNDKHYIGLGETKPFYYTVKETGDGASSGYMNIKLTVKNVDGKLEYYAETWTYLGDDSHTLYKHNVNTVESEGSATEEPIRMSGVEFSLGAFFNLTDTSLILSKKVEGDYEVQNNESYTVYVKDADNKYYYYDGGTLSSRALNGNESLSPNLGIKVPANGRLEIKGLPNGTYTISEDLEQAKRDGYTLSAPSEKTVTLTGTTTPIVTLTNQYTEEGKGSLTISKSIVGANIDDLGEIVFSTDDPSVVIPSLNKQNVDANIWKYENGKYSYTIRHLDPNKEYTITETKNGTEGSNSKYALNTSSCNPSDGKVTIEAEKTKSVDFTNTYIANKGVLVIKKTLAGVTDIQDVDDYITFSIEPAAGGKSSVSLSKYYSGDGTWNGKEWTCIINDVLVGEYTITETADGTNSTSRYTCTTTPTNKKYKVTVTKTNQPDADNTASFINTYSEDTEIKTNVVISKQTATGGASSELKGAELTLTSNTTGNVIDYSKVVLGRDASSNQGTTGSGASYTFISGETSTTIGGLSNGSYTLSENTAPIGYDTAASITFYVYDGKIYSDEEHKNEVTDNKIVMVDQNEDQGSLSIKKIVEGSDQTGFSADVTFPVTVTLSHRTKNVAREYTVSGYGSTQKVTFTGNSYTFNLKHDQEVKVEGIPAGTTYGVTEETITTANYSKSATNNIDYKNSRKAITKNTEDKVEVNNVYTAPVVKGNLVVSKTISGAELADFEKLTFTAEGDKGTKLTVPDLMTTKVGTGENQWKVTENADKTKTYTYKFTDLAVGEKFTVTETFDGITSTSTYVIDTNGTVKTGNATITKNADATVNLTDKYSKVEEKGNLVVSKTISGAELADFEKLTFTAEGDKGTKLTVPDLTTESVGTGENQWKVTENADKTKTYTYKFTDLAVGEKFTVTETFDGITSTSTYVIDTNGTVKTGNATITKNADATVNLTDKYSKVEEKGNLVVSKTISGAELADFEKLTFTAEGDKGTKLTVPDLTTESVGTGENQWKVTENADKTKTYTYKFTDLAVGEKFTVTETFDGITSTSTYVIDTNGTVKTGNATITKNADATVNLTDKYSKVEEKGNLVVSKTISGAELADFEKLTFTAEGDKGTKLTVPDLTTESVGTGENQWKVTENADKTKTYTYKFTNLAVGEKFTVTETFDGITSTSTYVIDTNGTVKTGNATITKNADATVNLTDKYSKVEEKGNLVVSKTISGAELADFEKLTFTAEGDKGTKLTVPDLTTESVGTGENQWKVTENADKTKTYTYKFTNLAVGEKFIVTETFDGITSTSTYVIDTNGTVKTGNATITKNADATVNLTDKYSKVEEKGNLVVSKTISGAELADFEKLTFTAEGDKGTKLTVPDLTTESVGTGENQWKVTENADKTKTYTYKFTNLAVGEKFIVTETFDGITSTSTYVIDTNGTVKTGNATITKNADATVNLTDKYSKVEEKGNLVVSKTISGAELADFEKLTFTAEGDKGTKLTVPDLTTESVGTGENQWKVTENADKTKTYTYKFTNLAVGEKFTVTETFDGITSTSTYVIDTNGTVKTGDATITKNADATVNLTDKYSKTEVKGNLVIEKTITSPLTEDEYNGKLTFIISQFEGQNTTGYITDKNGTIKNDAYSFTIKNDFVFVSSTDNGDGTTTRKYKLEISNVPAGDYAVTETNDTIDGYELTKSITPNSVTIDSSNLNGSVEITDSYAATPTPSGKIYITKNDAISMKELENAHIVVTMADGTPVDEWDTTTTAHELSVVTGDYIMTETGAPDGYQQVTTSIAFTVTVDANNKATVTTTDTNVKIDGQDSSKLALLDQPHKGSIKLTKTLKGDVTDEDRKGLSFTVTGPYNYNKTFVLGTDFTPNADKTYYELVLNDLPIGDYNITETLTKTDGTTCTVTYKVNGGETKSGTSSTASVTNGNTTTVDYENNYIKNKNLYEVKISKVDATNKKEIAGAQLELFAIDANGNQISGGYDKKWTSKTTVQTFTDITAGDYAIRELVAPEGYEKVETLFKFRVSFDANGKATVTSLGTDLPGSYDSEKDLITFENDPIKVTSEKGGMKVVVEEEGTGRRVPNATVEIEAPNGVKFPDGSTKIIVTTDENGEVTGYKDKSGKFIDLTTGLTPGDYKITVTKVPEGYKVTTGKTEVVTVKPGEVAEHLALIGTEVKKDEQTTEKTTETTTEKTTETTTQKPSDTPSTEVKQPNTTTTPNAPSTPQKDTTVVNTGDSTNVVPIIIVMIISLIGIIFLVSRKRKMRYEY